MANNNLRVKNGLTIEASGTAASEVGDLRVDASDGNRLKYYDGAEKKVLLEGDSTTTAVDNATVELNGSSQVRIKDSGVTTAKIAPGALTADASGRAKMEDEYVTEEKMASASLSQSNVISANMTATGAVANSSVSRTVLGTRPVMIILQPATAGSSSYVAIGTSSGGGQATARVILKRDSTTIATYDFSLLANTSPNIQTVLPSSLTFIDSPSAGTYSYSLELTLLSGSGTVRFIIENCRLNVLPL